MTVSIRQKLLALVIVLAGIFGGLMFTKIQPLAWSDCVRLGGIVTQESHRVQCQTKDGRMVVQPKSTTEPGLRSSPASIGEYYGFATGSACQIDADCIVAGCNSEICQSAQDEPLNSICVVPDRPTPKSMELRCACIEGACAWHK